MITIKKDGMVIQVETREEYEMVMGGNAPTTPVVETGTVAKEIFKAITEEPPFKHKVYLSAKCYRLWDVVQQYADETTSINSRELAELMGLQDNSCGAALSEMCRKGLLVKVPGHYGWTIAPKWTERYEVIVGRAKKVSQ